MARPTCMCYLVEINKSFPEIQARTNWCLSYAVFMKIIKYLYSAARYQTRSRSSAFTDKDGRFHLHSELDIGYGG